jgi:heme oxygenase
MFRTKKSEASKKSLKSQTNDKKAQLAEFLNLPQEFQSKESLRNIFRLYLLSLTDDHLLENEALGR